MAIGLLLALNACQTSHTPRVEHDLSAVETAFCGEWKTRWYHQKEENDYVLMSLAADRGGGIDVYSRGTRQKSDCFIVDYWQVRDDSLIASLIKPGYSYPYPIGDSIIVVDTVFFELEYEILQFWEDSIRLDETCTRNKRYCDGLATWKRIKDIDDLLIPEPASTE